MIIFSKNQRRFINGIKKKEIYDAESFIKNYCSSDEIILTKKMIFLNYTFEQGTKAFVLKERSKSSLLIFEFIDLCMKLEKEKLILGVLLKEDKIFPIVERQEPLGKYSGDKTFLCDESVLSIIHMFNKQIYPTSEICRIKGRKYKNEKDKYYSDSRKIAFASLILSLIIGTLNIYYCFIEAGQRSKNKNLEMKTSFSKIVPNDTISSDTLNYPNKKGYK